PARDTVNPRWRFGLVIPNRHASRRYPTTQWTSENGLLARPPLRRGARAVPEAAPRRLRARWPDTRRGALQPQPATLLRSRRAGPCRLLTAAGPGGCRGIPQRPAQEPLPRVLGRVRRSPRVCPRRRSEISRLGAVRPPRSLLRQALRGRKQSPLVRRARPLRVDGVRHDIADEVGLLVLPGDVPGVPDAASTGRGGHGAVRGEAGAVRAAALPADALAAAH